MRAKRYFTWQEASALLPRLQEIFGIVRQLRGQLRALYQSLEALGSPPSPETLEQPGPPEVVRQRRLFKGLYEALAEQLHAVEEVGCFVKDIDSGLVDFLYRRDGRDVFLCWRYGESEIAYWHDIEAGFAGRQPIEDADRAHERVLH